MDLPWDVNIKLCNGSKDIYMASFCNVDCADMQINCVSQRSTCLWLLVVHSNINAEGCRRKNVGIILARWLKEREKNYSILFSCTNEVHNNNKKQMKYNMIPSHFKHCPHAFAKMYVLL